MFALWFLCQVINVSHYYAVCPEGGSAGAASRPCVFVNVEAFPRILDSVSICVCVCVSESVGQEEVFHTKRCLIIFLIIPVCVSVFPHLWYFSCHYLKLISILIIQQTSLMFCVNTRETAAAWSCVRVCVFLEYLKPDVT